MGGEERTVEGEALGTGMACGREIKSEELVPVGAQRLETSSGASRLPGALEGWKVERKGNKTDRAEGE